MSERMIPLKIADMAVAACNEEIAKLQAENARLKAEVERLRKAGDEIIHEWSSGHGTDVENFTKALWVWAVAKEGKQS